MIRRGGVLFEVMLALALFIGAATFTLRATRSVISALDRSQRESMAVDIACAKMAELEAGMTTIAELRDPDSALDTVGSIESFAADHEQRVLTASEPEWAIEVETERSEFPGLMLVTLTVSELQEEFALENDEPVVSYTLRQLIPVREQGAGEYEEDEILEGLPDEAPNRNE
jgi:hypothetical protein